MGRLLPFLISLAALVVAVAWVASTSDLQPVANAIAELSWQTSATVFALFIIGASLASARLWFIARDIRSPISPHDAVVALTVGSLAGALFFQIMGQTIARSTMLARRGTPVAATLIMTGYERAAAMLVSLLFGVLGACYLFGTVSFDLHHGGGELLKLVVVGCLAVLVGAYLAWGPLVTGWLGPALSGANFGKATRSLGISVAIQLCTLAAYLVAAVALAPDLRLIDVSAAAAVVMLATAIPISFAGWGVREISTVLALGAIGMPVESALVVALQVGVMSLAALMLLSALSLFRKSVCQNQKRPQVASLTRPNFEMALAWSVPLATATLVFFQIYVPTAQGTKLNVNLADPLAVVGGVLFLLTAIRTRSWPNWRVSGLNQNMLLATFAMTVGLVIGWSSVGWTSWALTSKYIGWFVLLAYGLTGALTVSKAGETGRQVFFLTFIAAGAAVGGVEIVLTAMKRLDATSWSMLRASGVAANPNAFAFQMALVACAALVVIQSHRLMVVVLAVVLTALLLSASRAGLGAIVLVLVAAVVLLPSRRRAVAYALLMTAALLASIETIYQVHLFLLNSLQPAAAVSRGVAGLPINPLELMVASPDWERWKTITGGVALFQAHPLFGAGLGAFAESWRLERGHVQVIHSTPLWLLAEFGLVGASLIILPFVRTMLLSLANASEEQPMATLAFLICFVFAVMASVHELLYQRPLWLLLGATLTLGFRALPSTSHRSL